MSEANEDLQEQELETELEEEQLDQVSGGRDPQSGLPTGQ
jgi:hypothetical protein